MHAKGFSVTLNVLLDNLANTGRGYKQAVSIAVDSIAVVLCLWAAYSLRLGYFFTDFQAVWHLFLLMPIITTGLFSGLGIYRWVVRSANTILFRQLTKGCIVSGLALVLLIYLWPPTLANPRSVFLIFAALILTVSCGVRVVWQGLFQTSKSGEPIAIFGAGSAGKQLVKMLESNSTYSPVLLIDDDPKLSGTTLSSLPVLSGAAPELATILQRLEVGRIVLALPSLAGQDYQNVLTRMEQFGLPVQTLPGIVEIVSGKAKVDEIRDISINDILGRTEVHPDPQLISRKVLNKCVMVTGGGGSIGAELCRQIMQLSPSKLVIFDSSEENLYHISEDLENGKLKIEIGSYPEFVPVLGNILDSDHLARVMREHSVETIYHAAAYKHVPIVERQPEQGARANVFGTLGLLQTALSNGVTDFLLISTDKAVRPTNAMGASKRIAELILQAYAKTSTSMCISIVRFGNVLGSSGSVVPKFSQQIRSGGPITLTHSRMTRYFMTISEAAQLVLQASTIAKGGDVFVLDMGDPVRIEELATSMVRLHGKKLRRETGNPNDIEIVENGIRPGEKMYEELFITDEHQHTEVEKIYTAKESSQDWETLSKHLESLRIAVDDNDRSLIREKLLQLALAGTVENVSASGPTFGKISSDSDESVDRSHASIA